MYTLRLSRSLISPFTAADEADEAGEVVPTTSLGDWYVREATIGARHLAVCVSDRSLLTIAFPCPEPSDLPQHLPAALVPVLKALDIDDGRVTAELEAMADGQIALARDRGMSRVLAARVSLLHDLIGDAPPGGVDARRLHAALAELPLRNPRETCAARTRRLLERDVAHEAPGPHATSQRRRR
ncbi:MAG TPA: hypothetical protein VMF13_21740 [Luteitalea sp.]|nr:hypothetical protein [Luteitalea sp.]